MSSKSKDDHGFVERLNAYKVLIIGYTLFLLGGGFIVFPYFLSLSPSLEGVFNTIGVALLPTGLISLVNEYFLRRSMMSEMTKQFDLFLDDNIKQIYDQKVSNASIYESNPTEKVCNSFRQSNEQIFLLNNWIPDFDGLRQGLRVALSNDVKIRILLMNPKSDFSTIRGSEIGFEDPHMLQSYMRLDLDEIVEFLEEYDNMNRAEIRLFDELPAMPVYATEKDMYVGWYFKGERAVTCPVIKVSHRKLSVYKEIKDSFDYMWEHNNTVTFHNQY